MTKVETERMEAMSRELDELKATVTTSVTAVVRALPTWAFWSIVAVCAVVFTAGLWYLWSMVFGDGTGAAQEAEKLHKGLMQFAVASFVALAATAGFMWALTILLDKLTVRREFLAEVRAGRASPTDMAIFSVGTAIFAGLVFSGTISALSI